MNAFSKPITRRLAAGIAALATAITLTACSATATGTTATGAGTAVVAASAIAALADNAESHAEAGDTDYDAADATTIVLADGASKSSSTDGVTISGDVITIEAPGTYLLSGTLGNGQVVVDSEAEGKVRIVLDNVSVTNSAGSAFVVAAADEAVLVLADGSENSLTDGEDYDTSATDAPNAALFSMADLTIGGTGALTVAGNTNDGIAGKDGLVIQGGTITVTAVDDGIRGKDYLIIEEGTVSVESGDDGLKSDNETDDTVGYVLIEDGTVRVAAGDDGVHAEGDLAISGGEVTIAKSNEGLEGATVTLAGGATSVTASDDGVNASSGSGSTDTAGPGGGGGMADDGSLLTISGGTLIVDSGGDGLDSNGTTVITGGTTVVSGPTADGNGALDSNGGIIVTGGTVVAAGSSGMAESPSAESSTGWVAVAFDQAIAAGQTISVVKDGTVIAAYTTVKAAASLVVADADITSGQTYDIYVGGKPAGTTLGTYSDSGDVSGATKTTTVTAGEAVAGGMGGGRGQRP
ncbi:MAG: carbohydrate-binding domain-containing protein [Propionibacteriaceae bacterium]|nr:carbohydrate-binding domain-containing protein [Propionibacteriaceae bacterium]